MKKLLFATLLLLPSALWALDYTALKAELDAGHPTTGAYNANDSLAAGELNAVNRPAEGGTERMLNYCSKNRSRTNNGSDTVQLPILGRLQMVADAALGEDPFGTTVGANQVTREMKAWAHTFLIMMNSPTLGTLDFIDTEVDAGYAALGPGEGVVWKTPDIDALKAFSQNQQSRAQELGFGKVREGWVTTARALP